MKNRKEEGEIHRMSWKFWFYAYLKGDSPLAYDYEAHLPTTNHNVTCRFGGSQGGRGVCVGRTKRRRHLQEMA